MKQLAAFILGLFLTSPALADGTINTLTAGAALTGTELLPMFQTANPAVTTTPNALKTFVTATGVVTSITNSDGTLTISPAAGPAVASLALGHANTWTGIQTFSTANGLVYSGATTGTQVACLGLDASNNIIKSAAACGSGGAGTVTSVAAGCGTTASPSPITTTGTIFAAEVPNLRAGTTYTIANADCGTLNNFSNAASIAVTLPQAGSGGNFANGWYNDVCSIGAGTATITPTTSTIGGVATLVLTTNKCARIVSDGTNYQVVTYGGGGSGTPGGATNSIQYNNAGAFGGFGFTDGSANTAIVNTSTTTTAQSLTVYNTWSGGTLPTPTNYERGVFDWTTTANVLTIGTQKGGTGTLRNFQFVGGAGATGGANSQVADFGVTNGASWSFYNPTYFYPDGNARTFIGGVGTVMTASGGAFQFAGPGLNAAAGNQDSGISRPAAALLEINNGTAAGVAQLRLNGQTIASLPGGTAPACNATYLGARATVNNSSQTFSSTNFGAIISTTTGTNVVPVVCDGTNWRIG
jgi:hypothetical protein